MTTVVVDLLSEAAQLLERLRDATMDDSDWPRVDDVLSRVADVEDAASTSLLATVDPALLDALRAEPINGDLCTPVPFADGERVAANIHNDERSIAFAFDAAPYLRDAKPEEILDLNDADWENDEASDAVAYALDGTSPEVTAFFLRDSAKGFEVHVDESDARRWLIKHRPDVADALPLEVEK